MSISCCSPQGIRTSITRSRPSASTQSAAATELSFPPEMPRTALQSGPFSAKNLRIQATHASLMRTASNSYFIIVPTSIYFAPITSIWHIFIVVSAALWLSGVTPAQQAASTRISASGKCALSSSAFDTTQISVQSPISSMQNGASPTASWISAGR